MQKKIYKKYEDKYKSLEAKLKDIENEFGTPYSILHSEQCINSHRVSHSYIMLISDEVKSIKIEIEMCSFVKEQLKNKSKYIPTYELKDRKLIATVYPASE